MSDPPLKGIHVLELAGLAPGTLLPSYLVCAFIANQAQGPFTVLLLADQLVRSRLSSSQWKLP